MCSAEGISPGLDSPSGPYSAVSQARRPRAVQVVAEPVKQMQDLLAEADRQLTICNACRYCEGYCAVWPAMELRRVFKPSDVLYLANLCFDCRACFYACQFAPPHQFAVNIPKIFAQIRTETYQDYSWPRVLARMVKSNARAAVAITIACVVVVFAFVLLAKGPAVLFDTHIGEGAFF